MGERNRPETRGWRAKIVAGARHVVEKTLLWGEKLPRGLRAVVGALAIVAGLFGFLPILGFWMIPLGVALLALDVPPLRRWLHARLAD
jgi:hypothetical protein